jgi:hypothetical protein
MSNDECFYLQNLQFFYQNPIQFVSQPVPAWPYYGQGLPGYLKRNKKYLHNILSQIMPSRFLSSNIFISNI